MSFIFNQIIYRPIFNLLVLIYDIIPGRDFGLAIIVLTIVIRAVFSPLSIKAIRSQRELGKLQPKIKELQERHKNDKQALGQATMSLYKEHKVNPFGGCLPLLIQIPILIALYQAFRAGLDPKSLDVLYSFVPNPGTVREIFLGFINLTHKSPFLAIIAGVSQWVQTKLSMRLQPQNAGGQDMAQAMSKQMLYVFPVMIVIIAWNLPIGLILYWIVATLFSIGEQLYITRDSN